MKDQKQLRIIFVSRTFPPTTGGLQQAAFESSSALAQKYPVKLIKWGGSRYALPVIYPWLLAQTIWACWRNQGDVVYLQDGVLAITAVFIKLLSRKPVAMNMHGLDITFSWKLYRWMLRSSVSYVDLIITASDWSEEQIHNLFPDKPIKIISHGVKDEFYDSKIKRAARPTLLTTGRLVERKGVAWFIDNVMPQLVKQHPSLQYIVIGDGVMRPQIEKLIQEHRLSNNVKLLGKASVAVRNRWYNQANLFIMPNIKVPGDAEGFGLVALEAASCGTAVIGAACEGVKNAITPKQTGFLLKSQDAQAFITTISKELSHPSLSRQQVRQYILDHNLWSKTAEQYGRALSSLTDKL